MFEDLIREINKNKIRKPKRKKKKTRMITSIKSMLTIAEFDKTIYDRNKFHNSKLENP